MKAGGVDRFLRDQGLSFETLFSTIFQVSLLGYENASKLYAVLTNRREGSLDFGMFLECMKLLQTKTRKERVGLFLELADLDGNGYLDFGEILHLAKNCLRNNYLFSKIDFDSDPFLGDLARHFASEVFRIVGFRQNQQIPLKKIAQIIAQGHPQDDLLIFFCGGELA